MRIYHLPVLIVLCLLMACGGGDKEEKEDPKAKRSERKRTKKERPKKIPEELLWQVSTKATSPEEYDIKRRRRAEDGKEPTLQEMIDLSQKFFDRIQPLQASDSVLRYRGFDLEFFVPVMDKNIEEKKFVMYRRGSDAQPAAISIVDSLGPNNIDVYPFYVRHLILFFVQFHGDDVDRKQPLMVPGFFVNDFEGKGSVYFQPQPGKALATVNDLASVMLLKKDLIPERRLGLTEGQIDSYSILSWNDSTSKEVRYSFRHGRACPTEFLDGKMTLPDLVTVLKKRCGGANETLLPTTSQGRVPLWTEGPDYKYAVTQAAKRRALSEEDSLAAWQLDAGGGRRRPVDREAVLPPLSKVIQQAAAFRKKIRMPEPGARMLLGKGMDFRKLTVNDAKPDYAPRWAYYHQDEKGEEDFVMLVDKSPQGLVNLDVYPFPTEYGVFYFLDYHGQDADHADGQRIPGFFIYPYELRSNLYFAPVEGESVSQLSNLSMAMELDQNLFPKGALLMEGGQPKQHVAYKYEKPEGKRYNQSISERKVTDLFWGKECEKGTPPDNKTSMEDFHKMLRRPPCGKDTRSLGAPKENPLHPIWIIGTGLEDGGEKEEEKKVEENEESS